MLVELHAKSDVGRVRRGNEDNFLLLDLGTQQAWTGSDGADSPSEMNRLDVGEKGLVLVVSDGMGGALAGDVASRMAIDSVREVMTGNDGNACDPESSLVDCLKHATLQANRAKSTTRSRGQPLQWHGATLTGAAIRTTCSISCRWGQSSVCCARRADSPRDQGSVARATACGRRPNQ